MSPNNLHAFDALTGRTLRAIRALSPWNSSARTPSPSAAWIFEFGDLSLLCLSPLRLRSSQHGSSFGLDSGAMASFGFRVHLADRETPSSMLWSLVASQPWFEAGWARLSDMPLLGLKLAGIRAVDAAQDSWRMEFAFENGAIRHMHYRLDLDGSLEFTKPGARHQIDAIEVLSPRQPFGWLHPAAPLPFVFDNHCWTSAAPRDWPFSLRRDLRASTDPERLHHDILLGAMRARFQQNPQWRRRLSHLAYPVACPDCPSDIYETLRPPVSD